MLRGSPSSLAVCSVGELTQDNWSGYTYVERRIATARTSLRCWMMTDVPDSYEELFADYFGYVKGLVSKLGIRESEDVASAIMVRFYERGFLEKYDPAVVSRGRQTNFKAFLRAFVERYSRHYRERQGVRDQREPLKCDQPTASGKPWVEIYAAPHLDNSHEFIDELELILLCREKLRSLKPQGSRNLLKLFDLMIPQIHASGRLDRQALATQYGVSASVVSTMLGEMKAALADVRA
jgi:DNA-directed RNA polymerase specialized sigma24 family protein